MRITAGSDLLIKAVSAAMLKKHKQARFILSAMARCFGRAANLFALFESGSRRPHRRPHGGRGALNELMQASDVIVVPSPQSRPSAGRFWPDGPLAKQSSRVA